VFVKNCFSRAGGEPSCKAYGATSGMDSRLRGKDKINFCHTDESLIDIDNHSHLM
jgi:hypothetical protein